MLLSDAPLPPIAPVTAAAIGPACRRSPTDFWEAVGQPGGGGGGGGWVFAGHDRSQYFGLGCRAGGDRLFELAAGAEAAAGHLRCSLNEQLDGGCGGGGGSLLLRCASPGQDSSRDGGGCCGASAVGDVRPGGSDAGWDRTRSCGAA